MGKIRISGIGLVNQAGITAEALWEQLCVGSAPEDSKEKTDFRPEFPPGRLRRMNRYCKMALYASREAWKDGGFWEELDPFRRGTILTTGYGSMEAHLKFCRETAKGEPDFCSPTVFTGIVPNSCVGTVCMFLQCKGVSTVLSGGNPLEYSQLLLEQNRADLILTGAVEEYCEESFGALQEEPAARGVHLAEGCVVLALEDGEEGRGYCSLLKTDTVGLAGFPLLDALPEKETKASLLELLADYGQDKPDLIFSTGNGTAWDCLEGEALAAVFPETKVSHKIKEITGETIGCGFTMNVAAGALCLKKGYVPGALVQGADLPVKKLLVTGFDSVGNYMCALLASTTKIKFLIH